MSIGETGGVFASAAGSPLQQRGGPEADRRAKETSDQNRQIDTSIKSEKAAGIGETDEDSEINDRDADGRKLWEQGAEQQHQQQYDEEQSHRQSKDPDGAAGSELDLTG